MRTPELAPDSALGSAGYRLLMAAALPRLAHRRDRPSRALAKALRDTAAGTIPAEERAWIDRIEAHRSGLAVAVADTDGGWEADGRGAAERLAEAARAARWMSLPPVLGRLLIRLVRELRPRSCLELGTGFGISTAYQTAALELNGTGEMISLDIEGMTALAAPGLARLELDHRVELVPGLIEDTLAAAARRAEPIDYALLDADHTERGTRAAFDTVLADLSGDAVVVLDDINWTDEMGRAWRAIGGLERVVSAVGLRRLGIVIVSSGGDAG